MVFWLVLLLVLAVVPTGLSAAQAAMLNVDR
jgi:hypothetical protein